MIRHASTTATAPVSVVSSTESVTLSSEDQISKTIENWDVQAEGYRVFVAKVAHEQTSGGLFIPGQYQEEQCDGVVISAGPLAHIVVGERPADCNSKHIDDIAVECRVWLKPGDRVTYGKWSGDTVNRKSTVKQGLSTLMLMNHDHIIGIPKDINKNKKKAKG